MTLGEHLWPPNSGKWTVGEERLCAKCGARVRYATQPERSARIFDTVLRAGGVVVGRMTRCEPIRRGIPVISQIKSGNEFSAKSPFMTKVAAAIAKAKGGAR